MINNPVRKQLPTLENPGTAIDLRSGKSLIAPDGSVVTGTLPEVEQATPSISVSSEGLITASAVQVGGIVADGTKSATQQLTTQGAKTVTPGTSTQTAVASGRYTTGAVQVAGDANLKPENIAEGVSIFGVAGTMAGGASPIIIPFDDSRAISTRAGGGINDYHTVTFSYAAMPSFALIYPYGSGIQQPYSGAIILFSPADVFETLYGSSTFQPSIISSSNNQMQLNIGVDSFSEYLGVYIYLFN